MHWMLLDAVDVVGVVVFVITDSGIGARGEAVVIKIRLRSARAMVVKKRESVAEAILSCISSAARGFEFGMMCGPVHLSGDLGLLGIWGD